MSIKRNIKIILLILSLMAVRSTYAYWSIPQGSDSHTEEMVYLGSWKEILILEEIGNINQPKIGTEFYYQDQLYIIVKDNIDSIPNDKNWWGWNNPWSGVNLLTDSWVSTNYYNQHSIAVKYGNQYYLAVHEGASDKTPGLDTSWFLVDDDYVSSNIYPQGYIVRYGVKDGKDRFWISKHFINTNVYPNDNNNAWEEIPAWEQANTYNKNTILYHHGLDGQIRFWKALKRTSLEPSIDSAISGDYFEIENAWKISDDNVENKWFAHNIYQKNDVVVYGIDNLSRYRYFTCKSNNVLNQVPYYIVDGEVIINSTYWAEIVI